MYNHDGHDFFVIDGHMHFWDANPENWRIAAPIVLKDAFAPARDRPCIPLPLPVGRSFR
jgi:hypothetical protein